MEVVAGLVIALIGAGVGSWIGFYLAKRRDDRNRTADICLELYSGDFSRERMKFLEDLRSLSADDLVLAAKRDSKSHSDLRQRAFDIFNKYDLICYLRNINALDNDVFDEYAKELIASDYSEADHFFAAVMDDYKTRGVEEARPFFPQIAKVAPRTPNTANSASADS